MLFCPTVFEVQAPPFLPRSFLSSWFRFRPEENSFRSEIEKSGNHYETIFFQISYSNEADFHFR